MNNPTLPREITRTAQAPATTWLVTVVLTVCFTLSYTDRNVISLFVDAIKASLSLSDSQVGLIQGLSFSIIYVLASLPLSQLSDRRSRPMLIAACVTLWSVATASCGFARSFWQLMIARMGIAACESGLPPAALTLMADVNDARGLAKATSIFMLAPFLGGGLALIGGGALSAAAQNWVRDGGPFVHRLEPWRLVVSLVGLSGIIVALAVLVLLREPRKTRRTAQQNDASGFSQLRKFLAENWRANASYVLSMALMTLVLNAYVSWLPAALMRAHHSDARTIGTLFGPIFLTSGSLGTLTAGFVIGRSATAVIQRTFRYMFVCMIVAAPVALIAPISANLNVELALVAILIFCTSSVLGLSSLPMQFIAPPYLRARAIALLGLISALLGTGLGPLIVGVLSDAFHRNANPLSIALQVAGCAAASLAALLTSYAMKRTAVAVAA